MQRGHFQLIARAVLAALPAIGAPSASAQRAVDDGWTAGAARVEITPERSALGPTDVMRDPLFVRAIVIASGSTCAVLVGADQVGLPSRVVRGAIARAAAATGCSADNFVVSATHTHSSTTVQRGAATETSGIEEAIVKAVIAAKAAMRPARIGFGTIRVDLNVNRDLFDNRRWVQGPNPAGPSDKTLAVLELLGADDLPIAVYLNYAMHPINFTMSGVISADFPGEASRYIERRYGPSTVAIFAQGASGDQNPLLTRAQNKLGRVRTSTPGAADMRLSAPWPWRPDGEGAEAMRRRFAAVGKPVPPAQSSAYKAAIDEVGEIVTATGVLLGESAIAVMRYGIADLSENGVIRGASTVVRCPGRDRQDRDNPIREGALPPYADGAPVEMRVGVLRLGDAYIGTVDGEVYSEIGQRLKREAPVAKLMITTLANGSANSGYIYSNAARDRLTFQVIGSRLKPGCAEDGLVAASLAMIEAIRK